MKTSEIKIQVKAFKNYLINFVERLKTMDGTLLRENEYGIKMTERDLYLKSTGELWKMGKRYVDLKNTLSNLYPDFFQI